MATRGIDNDTTNHFKSELTLRSLGREPLKSLFGLNDTLKTLDSPEEADNRVKRSSSSSSSSSSTGS